jgi:adenosylcobinamide-GDP ribazoletransferase
MRSFFAALQFLTVFPLPASWSGGEKNLGQSIFYFPIVGLMLGTIIAGFDYGLGRLLPVLPASVFVVIALSMVSGGLHLDGLADTADGFLSSRPREQILKIMKDSRTGPMGVTAIVCVLALKIALLSAITGNLRWRMILLMPLAGRCALITVMTILPYARPEGGLGSVFLKHRSPLHPLWALMLLVSAGWLTASWMGLVSGVASFAIILLLAAYTYHKIHGLTGDTLGATCEIVEIIPALVAAIWIFRSP